MTDTIEKTPRQKSIDNGEQIVITIIVCSVLFVVFTLVAKMINGLGITIADVIRLTLTLVSCVDLYRGKNWAKLFLTFNALLGVFVAGRYVFLVLESPVFSVFNLILPLVMAILYALMAYYLIFSGDVDEFMKSRKV
jgi:hypothetical protein